MGDAPLVLKARCHCGTARFSYSFPKPGSTLPLKSSLCHCDDCRLSTGTLFGAWAVLPADPPDVSSLKEYRSSSGLARYFCGKCGATVANVEATEWDLASGLLETFGPQLLDRVQMFVDSTKDAGASIWLPNDLYGRTLKRYSRGRDSTEVSHDELVAMANGAQLSDPSRLYTSCHCGGVKFYIERPKADAQDTKHVGGKYKAAPCPCQSCRLTSGQEFMTWCYVPSPNIRALNGTPFDISDPNLAHYSSSDSVDRTFCTMCGAKVFYRRINNGSQPEMWDIAVGLFNGQSARLEDWLYWDPAELAYLDEAVDEELCRALKNGIHARDAESAL